MSTIQALEPTNCGKLGAQFFRGATVRAPAPDFTGFLTLESVFSRIDAAICRAHRDNKTHQ